MRELLPLLKRPAALSGGEWGVAVKDPETVRVRVALAFPDLYEVGMAYLGQRILYEAVNRVPELQAERVFAPSRETAALMREKAVPLASIETDRPLADFDILAFHLTNELCLTNVLYMLDLAGAPLRAINRDARHPLVIAGGGAAFAAEPLAPFLDLLVLGDGEEVLPAICRAVGRGRDEGLDRAALLSRLADIQGVYVPALFQPGPDGAMVPLDQGRGQVLKAVVADLDAAPFPTRQIVPVVQPVHDRLAVEIARGCTRGCRFCHAGMVYRPVRERSLARLQAIVDEGLTATGFEEVSFLSLSTGDFSALTELFARTLHRCRGEQVAVSLPSLRAGSLSEGILSLMASIRRTGATMAPEAATRRLRDVINKGITEEDILGHARQLFENGWQSVKCYFMIGLPTETDEDLRAIFELGRKILAQAPPKTKRLTVTCSVSPFVPKPHTPFQWEAQDPLAETKRKIALLRELFGRERRLSLKWHEPEMSWLEGVFSRGDRRLAEVLEAAYRKEALFSAWAEGFSLTPWREAFAETGIDPEAYLAARDPEGPLPWDHLSAGVDKAFLLAERRRAMEGQVTPDCRFGACRGCGVCTLPGRPSPLSGPAGPDIRPRICRPDQETAGADAARTAPDPGQNERQDLTHKAAHYRVWFEKTGPARYVSQLELTRVFERALRRAGVKPTFSSGYHPLPLLSFGWALPVGVESLAEWFALYLRQPLGADDVMSRLGPMLPEGLRLTGLDPLGPGRKVAQAVAEEFRLTFSGDPEALFRRLALWRDFTASPSRVVFWASKKGGGEVDIRPLLVENEEIARDAVRFVLSWRERYLSPLKFVLAVLGQETPEGFELLKTRQIFDPQAGAGPS